jgi:hypothetical protein
MEGNLMIDIVSSLLVRSADLRILEINYPRDLRIVSATTLNVRIKPDQYAPRVDQKVKGDFVVVLEMSGSWARIGEDRWVHADYLKSIMG